MAIPKSSLHVRSISLPSKSHPLDASIEDNLRRLSASQAGPFSSSPICQNLCSIKDLYVQMNDLIHFPHNQQFLSHELLREEVEEVLDGSLSLMDISSSTVDALTQMKESIIDLQSAFRRGSDSEGIHAYLISRKKINKAVSKCLAHLKKVEKSRTFAQQENDVITVRMLTEGEAICLSTFKVVLSYVMGRKAISETRGWSLVNKLMKSKRAPYEAENSEVEEVDHVLRSLSEKELGGAGTRVILEQLETLESAIHELEDGVESVSRCLVKTRVSLLNVLNVDAYVHNFV